MHQSGFTKAICPLLPRSVYPLEFGGIKNQDARLTIQIHQAYKPLNKKAPTEVEALFSFAWDNEMQNSHH
nr:hypothetical protein [Providencia rettgeri]